MHGFSGRDAGDALGRRVHIALDGEDLRGIIAKHDVIDLAQPIAPGSCRERGGQILAVLIRNTLPLRIESMHGAARLLEQRVIGVSWIVQSLWSRHYGFAAEPRTWVA